MPRVFIKTFGCQMNARDSEQVARMFVERGYAVTKAEDDADVILINTCSVRDQAEQKAIGRMASASRHRARDPRVVYGFLGCMAQSRGADLLDTIPHLDLVAGTQKYHKVVDHVDSIMRAKLKRRMSDPRFSIVDVEEESESQNTIRDHTLAEKQASAFVSIMQGCNMKCTFCIVPYTRGAERARPIPEIVEEVKGLAGQGVKEVTLLGQIVNLYGRHEFEKVNGKSPFVQLLESVSDVDGIERIRFTSPHPVGYKEDLIEAFTYLPKLAEHVHLPLQSGSDRILKMMHRPYKAAKFEELCGRIRDARPGMAISTDVIVGFPGETEEEYAATRSLCERIEFDQAYIFRYSKRRNTPAAEMDESLQLPERLKEERNRDLLETVDRIVARKNAALVGHTEQVLCEGASRRNAERLSGRTRTNKVVIFDGDKDRLTGQLFDVRIQDATNFTLYGDPVLLAV